MQDNLPKLVAASRQIPRGSLCLLAVQRGAVIERCNDAADTFEGFCWFHDLVGESEFGFESAEDCALDFLRILGLSLAAILNAKLVSLS